jgi:hypothetical protein
MKMHRTWVEEYRISILDASGHNKVSGNLSCEISF